MRIIIVGAGVVGYHLAERLSVEGHDISVVDARPELVRRIDEKMNVLAIAGNASTPTVLQRAKAENADLVIAVTNHDNTNLVVSLLAHRMGARKVVLRLRDDELSAPDSILPPADIGADFVINPIATTADLLERLVKNPGALDVAEFADGKLLLWGYEISRESTLCGKSLRDLHLEHGKFLIVAIARPNGTLVIPRGDDELRAHDHVYAFIQRKDYSAFRDLVHPEKEPVERVVIEGCTRLGVALARRLETRFRSVVMVDKDLERAEAASESLDKALVLHGDIADPDFTEQNNIGNADFYLALTGDDQTNLMHALLIQKLGVHRIAVQAQEPAYLPVLNTLDLGVVVTPRLLTVNAILRHIRRGRVLQVSQIGESGAEAREYLIGESSEVAGRTVKEISMPKGSLVGSILRSDLVVTPRGDTPILPGDHVIIFALPEAVSKVEKLFSRKR